MIDNQHIDASSGARGHPTGRPFVVRRRLSDPATRGLRRPEACVAMTRQLRLSGLLLALPASEIRTLLLMLTFVSVSGRCSPTLTQLAHAMQSSEPKARTRLQRLTRFHWQGKPLVDEIPLRNSGVTLYAVSDAVLDTGQPQDPPSSPVSMPDREDEVAAAPDVLEEPGKIVPTGTVPAPGGIRSIIIARSRDRYARPREDVERQLAAEMGWSYPFRSRQEEMEEAGIGTPVPDPESVTAPLPENRTAALERRGRLMAVGVTGRQADDILARYGADRIDRQLDWLSMRKAKSPARFIVAAIEKDYEPPATARPRPTRQELAVNPHRGWRRPGDD